MGTVTLHVDIAAAPSEVWSILEDVRLLPELSEGTTAVEAPDRLTAVGERFTQTVELGGRSFTSDWRVLEIDPGRRLVIEGSVLPGTRYRMVEELEVLSNDVRHPVTRLLLTMDYRLPFGPLGRLAAKLGVERRAASEAHAVLDGVRRLVQERQRFSAAPPPSARPR